MRIRVDVDTGPEGIKEIVTMRRFGSYAP